LMSKRNFFGVIFFTVFFAMVYFAAEADANKGGLWFLGLMAIIVYGSFLADCADALLTFYAITNRRLIILHPSWFSLKMDSYYGYDIEFVKKKRWKSGSGNLVFGAVEERGGKRTYTVEIGFFGIEAVDSVEALMLKLRSAPMPNSEQRPTGP